MLFPGPISWDKTREGPVVSYWKLQSQTVKANQEKGLTNRLGRLTVPPSMWSDEILFYNPINRHTDTVKKK